MKHLSDMNQCRGLVTSTYASYHFRSDVHDNLFIDFLYRTCNFSDTYEICPLFPAASDQKTLLKEKRSIWVRSCNGCQKMHRRSSEVDTKNAIIGRITAEGSGIIVNGRAENVPQQAAVEVAGYCDLMLARGG